MYQDIRIIEQAVELLKQGKVVAIPTETVYGLAAAIAQPQAVEAVYVYKNRPRNNPLIVHISSIEQLNDVAREIPNAAYRLLETFAPGPLTLILKKHPRIAKEITANQDSVAVRIPDHPLALDIINKAGPLAAPSANKSTYISPTTALHVLQDHKDNPLPLVVDGGPCGVGLESTILSLVDTPKILRYGTVSVEQLEMVLQADIVDASGTQNLAPGSGRHYAPTARLTVTSRENLLSKVQPGTRTAIICWGSAIAAKEVELFCLPLDRVVVAKHWYDLLRYCDAKGVQSILVESLPETLHWAAMREKLNRATTL